MMADRSIIKDVYFWERIGYRNAWVTVTQFPLAYMLAMKTNPIGLTTGISHERLNWLHRWVARTMFVTATVHGFHFWTEWVLADYVEKQLKNVSMIKYGLGAWAILLWNVVTGFYPIRSLAYEVFVLQHVASTVILIWVVHMHVPPEAQYHVWFAVALVVFDRVCRWALLAFRNLKVKKGTMRCEGKRRIGHDALVLPVGKSISLVTLKGVHFKWRAGQHLYLWVPSIGPIEAHPYTIACAHQVAGECCCNSIELVVRRHGGFSKRLYNAAKKEAEGGRQLRVAAFVSGPFGNPPRWDTYDTLILISASTGASFTLPILESVVRSDRKTCVRRIDFILTARKAEEIEFYVQRLRDALVKGREKGIELHAHVAITGCCEPNEKREPSNTDSDANGSSLSLGSPRKRTVASQDGHQDPDRDAEKGVAGVISPILTSRSSDSGNIGLYREYSCRLDISPHIRDPVEAAYGETAVAVCGGRPLVAKVRNAVASLSDERAVHKGTGAQGIHLHVEEYSF